MEARAMRILVLNGGSSSIKFSVFSTDTENVPELVVDGQLDGIGSADAQLSIAKSETTEVSGDGRKLEAHTLEQAVQVALDAVARSIRSEVDAVGYRVVHPGPKLREHCQITEAVLRDLQAAVEFAPLHDPEALLLIRATMQRFPNIGHFACFDTVFHQTMPEEANTYPLPPEFRSSGVRRYGFHGLSCESVVRQLRALDDIPRRMVIAHLGSGCSVTALLDGQSVDTTMGLTPTGGIVMGTRSGDLDPGLVIYLMRQQQGSRDEAASAVEKLLNKRSGIASLSMMPNDVKAVRKAANGGNADATLALKVFTRSIAKTIGAFCWLLGGLDAIVFTGGIGEHDPQTPAEVLAGLAELGIELDATAAGQAGDGIRQISSSRSKIDVRIVPAQEDRMISIHVRKMAASETKQQQSKGKP